MSATNYDRDPYYDENRSHNGHNAADRDGRMYDDDYSTPDPRDQHRRAPYQRGQYSFPSHDRNRIQYRGDDFEIKGASTRKERDVNAPRDDDRGHHDYRRGRSPSPNSGRRTYRDRDRQDYRSPSYHGRSRSGDRSRAGGRDDSRQRDRSPYYGGPPSREVMLEGLMLDMVEEDVGHPIHQKLDHAFQGFQLYLIISISKELKQYHNVERLEDVRVIRDRQTKASRGFGFIRFPSLEESKAFVERNYPMIYLYGNNSIDNDDQAAKVRLAFSRERDDRKRSEKEEGEWTCKICTFVNFPGRIKCHRCQTPQINMANFGMPASSKPQYMNSGDSDAHPNGAPSQFLLIRGLEPTVTEDLLAKGVAKLYKPGRRQSPPATSSKKGNAKVASTTGGANLGAKEGSLRRVLLVRDRKSNESWRYGFAEFGTIDDAQAALIRYNSFEKFTISSKPVTADYIHAGVFVPVLSPSAGIERFTFSPLGNTATKLVYWDEEAWASELVISTGSPKLASNESQARSAADVAAAAAEREGILKSGKEAEAKVKKRKADAAAPDKQKKAAPAHLQFWSNRHAELHGIKANVPEDEIGSKDGAGGELAVEDASPPSQSYSNLEKKCCYLCSRQFKEEAEVNKHERLSQLHRDNLKDKDLVSKAQVKMAKAGIVLNDPIENTSEYRDRARERRAAFGSSKKISLPLKKSASKPDEDDQEDPTPAQSKGASLLGKMGWSAGEGLGAQGTGMTAPIATDMYVQGVGLGAQGGKLGDAVGEAERNTKGDYSDFLKQTKDKAKERFEKMI